MSIGPTLYGSLLSSLGTSSVGHSPVSRVDWFPVALWYDVVQWLVQSWVEGLIFCHNEVLWSGLLKSVKGKVSIKKSVNKPKERQGEYDLIENVKICVLIIALLITRKRFFTTLISIMDTIFGTLTPLFGSSRESTLLNCKSGRQKGTQLKVQNFNYCAG